MKKIALSALLLSLTLASCQEESKPMRRRAPQSGAVSPSDGVLTPGVPGAPASSWDGLSDRPDSVWGF